MKEHPSFPVTTILFILTNRIEQTMSRCGIVDFTIRHRQFCNDCKLARLGTVSDGIPQQRDREFILAVTAESIGTFVIFDNPIQKKALQASELASRLLSLRGRE